VRPSGTDHMLRLRSSMPGRTHKSTRLERCAAISRQQEAAGVAMGYLPAKKTCFFDASFCGLGSGLLDVISPEWLGLQSPNKSNLGYNSRTT
jgi:hypothetical protein